MRSLKSLLLLLLLISTSFSHAILLMVDLESDSTIYIEGGLSTGRTPAGATLTIKEKATGRPIWQGALSDSGNVVLPLPENPYTVTLKLSEGHSVTKSGPIKKSAEVDTKSVTKEKTVNSDEKEEEKSKLPIKEEEKSKLPIIALIVAIFIGFIFGFKGQKKRDKSNN